MTLPRLRDLPFAAKWLAGLTTVSFLLNHLFAGLLVWQITRAGDTTAQEHFGYKSLAALFRMAHQHAFGHGAMYLITGALFLMAGLPARVSVAVITGAFLGAWLDIASWFLLKYSSDRWELLSALAGTTLSACFLVMAAVILYEVSPLARDRR